MRGEGHGACRSEVRMNAISWGRAIDLVLACREPWVHEAPCPRGPLLGRAWVRCALLPLRVLGSRSGISLLLLLSLFVVAAVGWGLP